eukprot:TRINITY_DN22626_c0_g1_i2.p1 TRINITY_DN22626_c0_g1~~TRINITY_DN22626_c0_g1_i2.p1  ORF type:complete len:1419 (-),score=283.99 TRINITY_DN22626_c0_g1_i2:74-4249(-)
MRRLDGRVALWCAILLGCLPIWVGLWPLAATGDTLQRQPAWRKAEAVLAESALASFQGELPHRWHWAGDLLLRPLGRALRGLSAQWLTRKSLEHSLARGGFFHVTQEHRPKALYRKWLARLDEACRVLGFRPSGRAEVDQEDQPTCPELWVDEAWPPSPLTPREKRNAPVWSLPANEGRSAVVLQARILKDFTPKEMKALLGFELGRIIFTRLPELLPTHEGRHLGKAFLLQRVYRALRRAQAPPSVLAGAPAWVQSMLTGRRYSWRRGRSRTATEFVAIGALLQRLVPHPMQPVVFGGLLAHGDEVVRALRGGRGRTRRLELFTGKSHRPGGRRALTDLAAEAFLFALLRGLAGSRSRALVVTLDRAAALAAGDARVAAASLLRVQGLLPRAQHGDLDETLDAFASSARYTGAWTQQRDVLLLNPQAPSPESRVEELLRWSQSEDGQRLIALAEVRRTRERRLSWLKAYRSRKRGMSESSRLLWQPRVGYSALALLLALPILTRIDAVRWASWCTLSLTVFGVALPLLEGVGAPALPLMSGASLAGVLLLYSLVVGSIWWNHLLGGARRWAQLSGQMASQLVDQADAAAGIACLTRDWAEMARRSLAALDQELCGSWRTSLHELASGLAYLRQELEDLPESNQGTSVARKALTDPSSRQEDLGEGSNSQRQQLAAWAGSLEAAVPRPTSREPLWLKVDRAVQKAAKVESARMRYALDATDPDQLQAMMTWWMARDANTAASGGSATARLLQEEDAGPQEEGETLGSLLFSERLHRRFPYPSFHGSGESNGGSLFAEVNAAGGEFERLERALRQNLEALQDLRSKLAIYQDSSRTGFLWSWSDVIAIAVRFREALCWPAKAKRAAAAAAGKVAGLPLASKVRQAEEEDPADAMAEFTTLSGLLLASCGGFVGSSFMALHLRWGWVLGCLLFGSGNAVMLRNYSRLHLPHIRRRIEHRLGELSRQREALMQELQAVQQSSQSAGLVHIRAHIFLQSVNVIRNAHYVATCVKTEVQRAGAEGGQAKQQRQVATSGLQLLLALVPHSSPKWQQEALAGEACSHVSSLLLGQRARGPMASIALARSFAESRKRLWLLFRMVHLSAAIPSEVQGQLGALAGRYLRPVLVERRVPLELSECKALGSEEGAVDGKVLQPPAIEDADVEAPKPASSSGAAKEGHHSSTPGSAARHRPASDAGSAGSEDGLSFLGSSVAGSSMSNLSRRSGSAADVGKALRKLSATRGDVVRVLARLPAASLLSQSAAGSAEEGVLKDVFSSIVVALPSRCLGHDKEDNDVAIATGYRFGAKPYALKSIQTCLELLVAARAPGDGSEMQELAVQLCDLADEEPSTLAAVAAWTSLAARAPLQFSEASLRRRRRHLRSAKDALKVMQASRR